ncbi:hypothetical protein H6504_02320 [Candidatus Woesearchaeota archaeon]|nr:hypothetical protein [Candidatus Woesearchaeota archaeon]
MNKGQASSIDLIVSLVLLILLVSFFAVGISQYLGSQVDQSERLDKHVVLQNLQRNLELYPTYGGNPVNWVAGEVDFDTLDNFGDISEDNTSAFEEYFFRGMDFSYDYDVCMFVLNESRDRVEIDGVTAYGNVSSSFEYNTSNYMQCEALLAADESPCHFYDRAFTVSKSIYSNRTYYTLFFVFCQKSWE